MRLRSEGEGVCGGVENGILESIDIDCMSSPKRVLSLFAGCGGLDYGFHHSDAFVVQKSYDTMKDSVDTYNLNYPAVSEQLDVRELLRPEFELGFTPDVIVGGPPCQDFSAAGRRTLGERASLTETFVDIVCKYTPSYFVMENVPAIRTVGKPIYDAVVEKVKAAGYGITVSVIYMPDYGVPQERKRLVMIGVKNGMDGELNDALLAAKTPVKSIREYMERYEVDLGLQGKEHIYRHPRNYERRGVYSIDELYPTVRGCLRKMSPSYMFHAGDSSKNRDDILSPDWKLVAALQTFPSTYKFLNKNNAVVIGNAVPARFSEILAEILRAHHTSA